MTIKKLSNNKNEECAVIYACEKFVIITKDSTIECKGELKTDKDGNEYYIIPEFYDNMLKELGFTNFEGQAGI